MGREENKCEICFSNNNKTEIRPHKIYGESEMSVCDECGHKTFFPKDRSARKDEIFSEEYTKCQQHNAKLSNTYKTRKYFIDYSRLILLSHYLNLCDDISVLEIGPGFPGLFQQLKLTGKNMKLFGIEPNRESRKLLVDYGVELIGDYFPSMEYKKYENRFDVIFAFNILYYFNRPIEAISEMLKMINGGGNPY